MENFDPEKPYYDLPPLPPTTNLDDVDILKKVNTANIALSRLNGASLAIPNQILLLEPLTIREAVASSGIENINTTVSEVFQAELFPISEASAPEKETLHYKVALLHGFDMVRKQEFLSTNSYIAIQSILEPGKEGIRRLPGTKIVDNINGTVYYTPPDGENNIRYLLKNFEDYYNEADTEVDPLIRNAILHYQFEAIHPFYDGNGRTGRILMVLHLVLMKRLDLPLLFLSGFINKNRSDYYRLIREVTSQSQWKSWILYILQAIEEQANATTQTIYNILQLQRDLEPKMREIKPALPVKELLAYLFSGPFYTRDRLSKKLSVHPNSGLKYLNKLEVAGILKSFTHNREKIFFLEDFLQLL